MNILYSRKTVDDLLKENYILVLKDGVSYGRVQYSDCTVYAI